MIEEFKEKQKQQQDLNIIRQNMIFTETNTSMAFTCLNLIFRELNISPILEVRKVQQEKCILNRMISRSRNISTSTQNRNMHRCK